MKISRDILCEKLLGKFTFANFGAENSDLVLDWPLFLRNGENLKDDQIYLADAGMIEGTPSRKARSLLLYIGTEAEPFLPFFSTVLVFRDIALFDLYDAVQGIYSEYEGWDEELRRILTSGGDLQELLNCSARIFDNPLVLYDKQFSVAAYTEKAGADSVILPAAIPLLGQRSLERLDASKSGEFYSRQTAVFTSPCLSAGVHSIYANISPQGKFQYRLTLLEVFHKFTPSDGTLLEHLANIIQLAVGGTRYEDGSMTTLASIFRNILIGEYTEAHILEQRLTEYGWQQKDQSFVWVRVLPPAQASSFPLPSALPGVVAETGPDTALQMHNLGVRIKELLPNSCTFEYSGGAAVLINLEFIGKESRPSLPQSKSLAAPRKKALLGKRETAAVYDKKPVWEKKVYGNKIIILADILDSFLEHQELKAGFSDVFTGTAAFREYYKQAELALHLGVRRNPQGRMFYFRDVKEVLLLDNCLKELPATMVCAPEILALKSYDRKHNTIYYETLYSYLRNNLRPVQTIKELNIHRSTLIYRLEKIQRITGMDTVNFDNQWYLLLSYKLLEHAARYGGT